MLCTFSYDIRICQTFICHFISGVSLLVLKEQIGNATSACVRCRQTAYPIQAIVWPRAKPEILQQTWYSGNAHNNLHHHLHCWIIKPMWCARGNVVRGLQGRWMEVRICQRQKTEKYKRLRWIYWKTVKLLKAKPVLGLCCSTWWMLSDLLTSVQKQLYSTTFILFQLFYYHDYKYNWKLMIV